MVILSLLYLFFLVLISADPFICTVLMEIMVQPKQALVCEGTENFSLTVC